MKLSKMTYFALAGLLVITLTGLTAHAEQQELNLSRAQVFQIQALLVEQTREISTLQTNVQSAKETLSAAIVKGDPVLLTMAVLSLDAAEKALKITQAANERDLLSLLNDSQKQVVNKPIPASD